MIAPEQTDGDFLRALAEGTRAQIPDVAKSYHDIVLMQSMASRMEAIALRLDVADTGALATQEPR